MSFKEFVEQVEEALQLHQDYQNMIIGEMKEIAEEAGFNQEFIREENELEEIYSTRVAFLRHAISERLIKWSKDINELNFIFSIMPESLRDHMLCGFDKWTKAVGIMMRKEIQKLEDAKKEGEN